MPDSIDTRVGVLERIVAKLEQRFDDMAVDVRALSPLIIASAEMRIQLNHLEVEIAALERAIKETERTRNEERETRRRDDRNFRKTLVGIGVAAILSPIGTLLVALFVNHT